MEIFRKNTEISKKVSKLPKCDNFDLERYILKRRSFVCQSINIIKSKPMLILKKFKMGQQYL